MQVNFGQFKARIKRTATAGFTLVEVMIACLIGAVIFAALFTGLSEGDYIIQRERENLRASQILVARIEAARLCAWSSTNGTPQLFNTNIVQPIFTDTFYPASLGGYNTNSVTYHGTINVTTPFTFYNSTNGAASTPTYAGAMAQVTVSLTWSDTHNGQTTTFLRSMKTYIAQYGIQTYVVNN